MATAKAEGTAPSGKSRARRMQKLITTKAAFAALLWARLPLAAFAGMRVERLDEERCDVSLPSGWKTQNPFKSMYFAAQAMAAEASTGVPALWFIEELGAPVASLVTGIKADFTKKGTSKATFTFEGGQALRAAIEQAAASGEPVVHVARSTGRQAGGEVIAEFEITWSFKRRSKK
jgi:acyl-coenzyme A thioesterase PaaI-like protein